MCITLMDGVCGGQKASDPPKPGLCLSRTAVAEEVTPFTELRRKCESRGEKPERWKGKFLLLSDWFCHCQDLEPPRGHTFLGEKTCPELGFHNEEKEMSIGSHLSLLPH